MKLKNLYDFKIIDDPCINKSGNFCIFTITNANEEKNDYQSSLVLYDVIKNYEIDRIGEDERNFGAIWKNENEFLFISKGNSEYKLNLYNIQSKKTEIIIKTDKSLSNIGYSYDENYISYLKYDEDKLNENQDLKNDVLFLERFNWKSDALGYIGNSYKHLYIYDTNNSIEKKITDGKFDTNGYAWGNISNKLVYITNKSERNEFERKKEIYYVSQLNNNHEKINEFEEIRGNDISFSPNDLDICVCGHNNNNYGHYGFQKIWLINIKNKEKKCITSHLDISFGDYSRNYDLKFYSSYDKISWSKNGKELYALSNEFGYIYLNKINIESGKKQKLFENNSIIYGYSIDGSEEKIVTIEAKSNDPCNIYIFENGKRKQLTNINSELLNKLNLKETEEIWYEGENHKIIGWVNESDKKEGPVLLYNGGGPGGMRCNTFVFENHFYNKQGFTVINCNARGNYGHGEEYSLAIKGKWGDLDVVDNIDFLNSYLNNTKKDKNNLFVAGGSYGGYITNWMICEHPEKFDAAVVDRTVFSRASFFGTSDMGFHLDKVEHSEVMPWDNINTYFNRSPISKIKNIKIPTLVVHSAADQRCTVDQGDQLYSALKYFNIKTKYVRFYNENHDLNRLGKPKNRLIRINEYLNWFLKNKK